MATITTDVPRLGPAALTQNHTHTRRIRVSWPPLLVLGALAVWAVGPLIGLQVGAWVSRRSFTGVDDPFAADVYQYLSWVRDAAGHVVVSDQFRLASTPGDYLQPMALASGMAWRAGVPLVLSYLLWLPVALVVVAAGYWAYVRRLVPSGPWARGVALVVALFCLSPTSALLSWLHLGSPGLRNAVASLSGQVFPAGSTLGGFPQLVALGLMPVFLIGVAGLLDGAAEPGRPWTRRAIWTGAAGLMATWLHPWQGEVLILTAVGLAATTRTLRGMRRIALPVAATTVPLGYYWALYRLDPDWQNAAAQTRLSHFGLLALAVAALPLLLPASASARSFSRGTTLQRTTVLWIGAGVATYLFLAPSGTQHGIEGIGLPLAVLIANTSLRLPMPAVATLMGVLIVPGLVQTTTFLDSAYRSPNQSYSVTSAERSALTHLVGTPAGGVLADLRLAPLVPSLAGHPVWVGHPTWTPHFAARAASDTAVFSGSAGTAAVRRLVREADVRYVLTGCTDADLADDLRPLTAQVWHSGCASVYELKPPGHPQ